MQFPVSFNHFKKFSITFFQF